MKIEVKFCELYTSDAPFVYLLSKIFVNEFLKGKFQVNLNEIFNEVRFLQFTQNFDSKMLLFQRFVTFKRPLRLQLSKTSIATGAYPEIVLRGGQNFF